jgi:hypothetical protein
LRRRKRFNPGGMPVIGGLAGDGCLLLKRLAAGAAAATLLFVATGGNAALARKPVVPPTGPAAIANAPLLTMEGMISAGQKSFDDSLMVEPESSSLVQEIFAPILKGHLLPEISLADATLAGVGGDELAYTYGEEATEESPADEDPRPAGDGAELAEAPHSGAGEETREGFVSPSLGGDEESPEEIAASDPTSYGTNGADTPEDATSSELGSLGIPADQRTPEDDGPVPDTRQPPVEDADGQPQAYPEPVEEDGPAQPADPSGFIPGPTEEGSPGGDYPPAEEQQAYDGSSTSGQEPPVFGAAPDEGSGSSEDAPGHYDDGNGDEASGDDLAGLIGEDDAPGDSEDAPGHDDGTTYDDRPTGQGEDPGDSGSAPGQDDSVGASPEVIEAVEQYLQTGDRGDVEDAVGDDVEEKTTGGDGAGSPPDHAENDHGSEPADNEDLRSDADHEGSGRDDQNPVPDPTHGAGPEAPPSDPAGEDEASGGSSSEEARPDDGFGLPRDASNGQHNGSDGGGHTQEPQPKPEENTGSRGHDSSGEVPDGRVQETPEKQNDQGTDGGGRAPEQRPPGTTRDGKGGSGGQDVPSSKDVADDRRDARTSGPKRDGGSDRDKDSSKKRHGGDRSEHGSDRHKGSGHHERRKGGHRSSGSFWDAVEEVRGTHGGGGKVQTQVSNLTSSSDSPKGSGFGRGVRSIPAREWHAAGHRREPQAALGQEGYVETTYAPVWQRRVYADPVPVPPPVLRRVAAQPAPAPQAVVPLMGGSVREVRAGGVLGAGGG